MRLNGDIYPPSLLNPDHFLHSDLGRLVMLLWLAPTGFLVAWLGENGVPTTLRWVLTAVVALLVVGAVAYVINSLLPLGPAAGRYSKGRHRR